MAGLLEQGAQGANAQPPAEPAPQGDLRQSRITRGKEDMNTPQTPLNSMRKLQERVRPGEASVAGNNFEQDATPEEQAEHDRAIQALSIVLYKDERTSNAVVQQLSPKDKIGSVAKAAMMTVSQLDEQFDFDEVVIPELTLETVDRIVELYETVHGDEFSEKEAQAAVGAAWEGVMNAYGIEEADYAELTAGMSDEEFGQHEANYKQFLGES